MKRFVIIGKWVKGKKVTIIDLHTCRELRQGQKIKERNNKAPNDAPDHKALLDI